MSDDGVALFSTAHPKPPLWRRVLFWFRRPRLNPEALEDVEVDFTSDDIPYRVQIGVMSKWS